MNFTGAGEDMGFSKLGFSGKSFVSMGTKSILSACLLLVVMLMGSSALPFAHAFTNGEKASKVIGQPDFTTGAGGSAFCAGPPPKPTTQSGLCGPFSIAFDKSGNLWVADEDNSRVLRFKAPFRNGEKASLVIGQANFTSRTCATTQSGLCDPRGIAFDSEGDLWVADEGNNRVVTYEAPFRNGEMAAEVIGQPNFMTKTCAITQNSLCSPSSIAFDESGNLWVADFDNNRVLRFNENPSNGENATLVIGQTGFTTDACATSQSGLCGASSIAFDPTGDLWVADDDNHRVVTYESPFSTGEKAAKVIGQMNFTSSVCAVTQSGLCNASGIAFDPTGDLWVVDHDSHRVLTFETPLVTGEKAAEVIGQPSFTTNACATTQSGLCEPSGIAFDRAGHLWVADDENNRVLEFK